MSLIGCPECGRQVSDAAFVCPACGRPLREDGSRADPDVLRQRGCFEYRSRRMVLGLPLVHVLYGPAWLTGFRPARGILAVGHVAVGVVALGGIAIGAVALGGLSLGLICFGGVAIGLGLGVGGIATGYLAIGGIAIGAVVFGGVAKGVPTLSQAPLGLGLLGVWTARRRPARNR